MNNIYVDENIPFSKDFFGPFGEITTFAGRTLRSEDLQNCDILIVRSITQVNAKLLEGTPVKFVGTATAGTNHIKASELKDLEIHWDSAAGCNAKAVSEYVLAIIADLMIANKLNQDSLIGIVGYGNVGQALANKLSILNIPFKLCDPPRAEWDSSQSYFDLKDLNDCDLVSFHTPYTTEGAHPTHKLWNQTSAETFKQGLHLINACRGEIFDEEFILSNRVKFGQIDADVFWNEPKPQRAYVETCHYTTPHIAGYSLRGKLNGSAILVDKLNQFLGTHHPVYQEAFLRQESSMSWEGSLISSLQKWMPSHYHPQSDHKDFIQSLNSEDRGVSFDQLRKNYPVRPEFEDVFLTLSEDFPQADREKLQELGMNIL